MMGLTNGKLHKLHISIVILLVLGNILFFSYIYNSKVDNSYVYSTSNGDAEYYILHSNVINKNPHLNDIISSEQIGKIKSEEVIGKLLNEIKSSEEGSKLAEDIKKNIDKELKQTYKNDLKQEIAKDYTHQYFKELEKSYSLLEELKVKYLNDHYDEIKQSIINDLTNNYGDEEINKSKEHKHLQINKQDYLSFLINDFIFSNAPNTHIKHYLSQGDDIGGNMFREALKPGYTKKFLTQSKVKLTREGHQDLQEKHDNLVKSLKTLESPSKAIFNGDGIVINGGGVYLSGAIIVIIQLRELGSKLPIELILNDESEYDDDMCNNFLPKLNTTCKIIETELGKELYGRLNLEKYQLKTVGLLVSSFDNIITLDADNLPIKNPDFLLNSEPYLSTQWLLWPDIWHKGTSPIYYDIARFKIGEPIHREGVNNEIDFADYIRKDKNSGILFHNLEGTPPAMSAETGQMVFSKSNHLRSLILSLYYNIYGNSHYYRLLYQGTFGSGDRETFIPALHVMNEPYHLNNYQVWFAGYEEKGEDGSTSLHESTMVQHDPKQTMKFFLDWEKWLGDQKKDTRLWPFQDNEFSKNLLEEFLQHYKDNNKGENYKLPDVLFLHMHKPKINPILNNTPGKIEEFNNEIYTRRYLDKPGKYQEFGENIDWELKFNSIAKWVICDGIKSENFWSKIVNSKQKDICKQITNFVDFLKKDTNNLKDSEYTFKEY